MLRTETMIERIKITKKINKILLTTAAVFASAVCFLSSCSSDTVYFSYQPVDSEHWDKSDDLNFDIVSSRNNGTCDSYIVLRTNDNYPFKNLSLYVETSIRNNKEVKQIDFDLTNSTGSSIRHNDYIVPFKKISLNENDTLHVRIVHNMQNAVLKGITNAGIKIVR